MPNWKAVWEGWQEIIPGQLWRDNKTGRFYGADGKPLSMQEGNRMWQEYSIAAPAPETAPPTELEIGQPEPEKKEGYTSVRKGDWVAFGMYDDTGNFVATDVQYAPQWQQKQAQQEFAAEQSLLWTQNQQQNVKLRETMRSNALVAEQQRMAGMGNTLGEVYGNQPDNYRLWDSVIGEIKSLAKTNPELRVYAQAATTLTNPYNPPNIADEVSGIQESLKILKDNEKDAKNRIKEAAEQWASEVGRVTDAKWDVAGEAPSTVIDDDLIFAKHQYEAARNAYEDAKVTRQNLERREIAVTSSPEYQEEVQWATPRPTGQGANMVVGSPYNRPQQKIKPTIPEHIKPYMSGEQWGAEVAPPSGQLWAKTSPELQKEVLGYASYAGQQPENLLWQAASMLPQSPSRGTAWKPARQRGGLSA